MIGVFYDTVDSTNNVAQRLVGAEEITRPTCIVARHQTAGRGTRGRQWASPPDAGIYLSIVDPSPAGGWLATAPYTRAAGVACAQAIADVTGRVIQLKAVNDLYVDGRKLGGVLVESTVQHGRITSIITGIGINVREVPLVFARDAGRDQPEPTSLEFALGRRRCTAIETPALIDALCRRILAWNHAIGQGQREQLQRAWRTFVID